MEKSLSEAMLENLGKYQNIVGGERRQNFLGQEKMVYAQSLRTKKRR